MTSRGAAVAAALIVSIALGCWWMLNSASSDAPESAPVDVAPSKPPRVLRRRHAPAAAASKDAPKPAESDAPGTARLVVRVNADETGDPVAGADVYVADRRDKEHAAKTDADGVARFRALSAGTAQVLVEAPGFARSIYPYVVVWDEAETETIFELERGAAVTGVVLDETGRPLAGASATATGACDDWMYDDVTPLAEATTAADGTFRLSGVPALTPSFLQFTAPNYAVTTIAWDRSSAGRVEARLVRAGRLEGRVREPSGRPAAEAHVKACAPDRPEMRETTDAEGRFAIEKLPVGVAWNLRAEEDGFIDAAPVDVVVRDGASPATCDLRLRKRPRLEFLVLDGAGAPVDAAEIDVKDASARFEPRQCVKGRATFDVAEPGACRVAIDAPRFVPHEETVEVAIDETKQVVVRMDAGVSLAGVVVDDAGTPVAGAAIEIVGGTVAGFGGWTRSATSAGDGAFRVEGLIAGSHPANAEIDAHAPWRGDASAPSDGLRIVLPRFGRIALRARAPTGGPPAEKFDVHCVLVDDDSKPVPESAIERLAAGEWTAPTWTDGFDVPAGRWLVDVWAHGYVGEYRYVTVAAGATTAADEIVLDRGQSFEGVVVDDVGVAAPAASVMIHLRSEAGREGASFYANVQADGTFRVDALGRWVRAFDVVGFFRGGEQTEIDDVRIGSAPVRVSVRRNGAVAFRVRGAADETLEAVTVRYDDTTLDDVPASGEVRLSLRQGDRRIVVAAARHAPATLHVVVTPGCDIRLPDVVLAAGATLVGRVFDVDGRAVAEAGLQAEADEWSGQATTDASGVFRIEHVPAGHCTIAVKHGATTLAKREAEVRDGDETSVEIVVPK